MQASVERKRADALKCRDLAETSMTAAARDIFLELAQKHDAEALALELKGPSPRQAFNWNLL